MTPLQIKALVIAAVIALLCTGAYFKGRESGLERYYELKSQVDAAQAQAERDAAEQRERQAQLDRDTAAGWAAAVDYWRDHRRVRVLPGAGCVPQAGALPAPAADPHARPAEPGSGPIELTAEQCEARINAAVLDAAQVVHLIQWIRLQHEASK